MKTYLVTGGAGFIGSNFVRYILEKYNDVKIINLDKLTYAGNPENLKAIENDLHYSFIKGDVCDERVVRDIFERDYVDYVVHFAAESHVDRSIENPASFAQTNVFGVVNLLNCAMAAWAVDGGGYKDGVKFVNIGTDEVYGALGADGYFTEQTPLSPNSPYAASKASGDMFVKAYHETFGLPVNITRCSNNYGAFQFPEKLIPLVINNALNHKPIPLYGDGMQVRDWLYVRDHCKAIDMVIKSGKPGEIYNVGGHNERTNIDTIKTIVSYLNSNVDSTITQDLITSVTDRKGHDRRYAIDPAKITAELGWYPETPIEQGIELTVKWYVDNREWLNNVTSGAYLDYYKRMYGDRK